MKGSDVRRTISGFVVCPDYLSVVDGDGFAGEWNVIKHHRGFLSPRIADRSAVRLFDFHFVVGSDFLYLVLDVFICRRVSVIDFVFEIHIDFIDEFFEAIRVLF